MVELWEVIIQDLEELRVSYGSDVADSWLIIGWVVAGIWQYRFSQQFGGLAHNVMMLWLTFINFVDM